MRFSIMIFFFLCTFLWAQEKKILIFSCHSGAGHVTTAQTLKEILKEKYEVVIVYPQDEISPSGTDIYCKEVIQGNYFTLNFNYLMSKIKKPFNAYFEDLSYFDLINTHILREKPDILISVVPFANYLCVDAINNYQIPFIVCTGKSEEGAESLKELKLKNGHSMTVLGYTSKISDYMVVSDIFITKPGAISTEEALVLELPILIDATKGIFFWEKANADLVQEFKVGSLVHDLDDLASLITSYLKNKDQIKKFYQYLPKNNFIEKIKKVVDSLE